MQASIKITQTRMVPGPRQDLSDFLGLIYRHTHEYTMCEERNPLFCQGTDVGARGPGPTCEWPSSLPHSEPACRVRPSQRDECVESLCPAIPENTFLNQSQNIQIFFFVSEFKLGFY